MICLISMRTTLTTMTSTMSKPSAAQNPAPRRRKRSARRRARELALQAVYGWLLHKDASLNDVGVIDAHIQDSAGFNAADTRWYGVLFTGVSRHADALRATFVPYIDRGLEELSPIEHSILLIASYELVYHIDVPYRVVINEAVELAKGFGGTDGFKFVNSVLDRVALDVRGPEVSASQPR